MEISYRQLSPSEALKLYCDWLMEQEVEGAAPFLKCYENGEQRYEWYMIFYSLRTLMLGGKVLNEKRYSEATIKYMDNYISEQLPNGGFTSNYRQTPTEKLSKKEFHEILRSGKVNIADAGSNVLGLIQALSFLDAGKKKKYIEAVRRWFDDWAAIWQLKDGCGNGIWVGHKLNSAYTMAMANISSAYSAFGIVTGEYEYIENAERLMAFQATQWLPDGRPLNLSCYPLPGVNIVEDYSRIFYLLEGMCWTHFASKNKEVKDAIAKRLKEWIFGEMGILSQWRSSWFNFNCTAQPPAAMQNTSVNFDSIYNKSPQRNPADDIPSSRLGIRLGWELAKSNGIIHALQYYLDNIDDNLVLREKVDLGIKFLSHPLKSRMSGVASESEESYGAFAVQATGFAGLSLAQAVKKNIVFEL